MNIKDLVEEAGYNPKRKASCHGGEYSSACPFCQDGKDRFLIWPQRHNKNNEYQGGRYSCRVCGKYGDAITFMRDLNGIGYLDACKVLRIEPKKRNRIQTVLEKPKLSVADEPLNAWKEKAWLFTEWANKKLLGGDAGLEKLRERGFQEESISKFRLGYNPQAFFRTRTDWGLHQQLKEDGTLKTLWLPPGLVIPTFSENQVIKVKIRRTDWKEGDKLPKYVEVSGSKMCPSIFGDTNLPYALVLESELDALLVQQEAGDLLYCIALGGSTKTLDAATDLLLRRTKRVLFLPDFDKAGGVAWAKWKESFPGIQRILTPHEKSAGDYFAAGGDVREWLRESLQEIERKMCGWVA